MSTRYSAAEVRNIVRQIEVEAKQVGLIPADAYMSYHPGNTSQGISGYTDCFTVEEDGSYKMHRVDFMPEFTYKQTKTDHAALLNASLRVLHALRRLREESERAKRVELSAHVARRSE